jgi:ankyrin repeat protein
MSHSWDSRISEWPPNPGLSRESTLVATQEPSTQDDINAQLEQESNVALSIATPIDRTKLIFRKPRYPEADPNRLKDVLISAVNSEDQTTIEQLLERGISPDIECGVNLILKATRNDDLQSLKLLLEFGGDPNSHENPPCREATPIYLALHKSKSCLQILLAYGADPNAMYTTPDTPIPSLLQDALQDPALVLLLLRYGADPNYQRPLIDACCQTETSLETVRHLIDYGASINDFEIGRPTSLFAATTLSQRLDFMKILLEQGADVNLQQPLFYSVSDLPAMTLLLNAGADPKACHGIVGQAVIEATVEALELLLDAGADLYQTGVHPIHRGTPLETARSLKKSDMVELLLSRGAT